MSLAVLQRVKQHMDDAGLLAGYDVKYFRWTDADVEGAEPFVLFRQSGETGSDEFVQGILVQITLVTVPTGVVAADALMEEIMDLFLADGSETGAFRFDVQGGVVGPMYLDNGRPVFTLDVRVMTEDQ